MSAFMVDDEHLCLMVQAGLQRQGHSGNLSWYWLGQRYELDTLSETADRVVSMLHTQNAVSVRYRYQDHNGMIGEGVPTYRKAYRQGCIPAIWALKAIDCYRYQACEDAGWEQSEAFAFCAALEHRMIASIPGYDDAPTWSYSSTSLSRWEENRRKAS